VLFHKNSLIKEPTHERVSVKVLIK
jgi:hypothetical protein